MTTYVLGHHDTELERLERQGLFLHDLTRDLLIRAGVRAGMRVLDYGCGAGDVTAILAELVGPTGEVVALDRAAEAVERTRHRMALRGAKQVRVVHGDDEAAAGEGRWAPFDVIAGRLVLLHQRAPAESVARLAELLRPGGLIAFQEIEIQAGFWANRELPTFASAWRWIVDAFCRGGMPTDISAHLAEGFERAGLVERRAMREGRIESGAESLAYEFMARTVRTLLPALERFGIARADEVAIDTLEARMREEAVAEAAQLIPVFFTSAWARRAG